MQTVFWNVGQERKFNHEALVKNMRVFLDLTLDVVGRPDSTAPSCINKHWHNE